MQYEGDPTAWLHLIAAQSGVLGLSTWNLGNRYVLPCLYFDFNRALIVQATRGCVCVSCNSNFISYFLHFYYVTVGKILHYVWPGTELRWPIRSFLFSVKSYCRTSQTCMIIDMFRYKKNIIIRLLWYQVV